MMYHQLDPILASLFVAGNVGRGHHRRTGRTQGQSGDRAFGRDGLEPVRFFVLPRLIGVVLSLLV